MTDVVLSNDDITVLAPPEIIEVLLDIGPPGQRGSTFFTGTGNPNSITVNGTISGTELILSDMYIRTSPGVDYGYLYKYESRPGGNTWVEVLKISPTIYSKLNSVTFASGSGVVVIDISDIYTVTGPLPTSSSFSIQHNIINTNPVSSSISDIEVINNSTELKITFKAIEYSSSTWQNLSGGKTIHLFISLVS